MNLKSKIKIVLFSGGTGNVRFVNLLNNMPEVELCILVNGYDDGKSTGEIRKFIPGMLGPSDFRKNISHLINHNSNNGKIFDNIINYRFEQITKKKFKSFLELKKNNQLVKKLGIYNLSYEKFLIIQNYFNIFLDFYKKKNNLNLLDISLGNILIASAFLKNNKNFNVALKDVQNFFELKNEVLNITDGENLFLHAILEDGSIITNEEDLVQFPHSHQIDDIFLLPKKILKNDNLLNLENKQIKITTLKNLSVVPKINLETKSIIQQADVIIYGPGTQFSSLFPSYITKDLKNFIQKSKAVKFLVTNIFLDNDILNETVESIVRKFYYFFNSKNLSNNNQLVNYYLVNKFDREDVNLSKKDNYLLYNNKKNYVLLDWEKGAGLHYPNWLAKKIFDLSKKSFLSKKLKRSVVSIVVPSLNEKDYIDKVLRKLTNLKINAFNLVIELIVIDGGSNDGTIEIIKKYKNIKFYSLTNAQKGEVIKLGIQKSKGDVIVLFPSDNEYAVEDIEKVIAPIMLGQSNIVYGSRMIKCLNLDDQLTKIYRNNYLGMLLSKYGGKLINLLILFFFNKSISDPFTSIKAFDANLLKKLTLNQKGFALDFEIFVKLNKNKNFFLEVPVLFNPRQNNKGKKMTVAEGIKCLMYLIFNRFIN